MTNDVAAAESREVLEGRLTQNKLTYPLAPLLEGEDLQRYLFICNHWDALRDRAEGLPGDPHRSRYVKEFLSPQHAGEAYQYAIDNGSPELLNYLNGLTNRESGMSVVRRLVRLQQRLRTDGYMVSFAGATDAGKTNLALLMAELAMLDNPEMHLITNMTSLRNHPEERTHVIENYHEMEYLVSEFDREWIIALDELSSHASGYATDRSDVEEYMRPFSRALAKYSARLINIGHQGDIHPTLREFSKDFVMMKRDIETSRPDPERDTYTAEFYAGVSDDGREPEDLRFKIPEVPQVGWSYSPNEQCRWSFEEPE